MDILFMTLLILVVGALCIACFFVGAKVGQTVSRGETVEMPKIDPMQPIREMQERKAEQRERERYEAILRNVDNYDGTDHGQEDIPRG